MEKIEVNCWELASLAFHDGQLKRIDLYGPPGVAKTHTAREWLAGKQSGCNGDPVEVTLFEDTAAQELLGHYIPEGNQFVWHDGPVLQALRHGRGLIINELSRASASVLDMMLAVLDTPAVITLPTGETVKGHKDFRVIATSNNPPSALDPALQDRFQAHIEVHCPSPSVVSYLDSLEQGLGQFVLDSYAGKQAGVSPRKALTFHAMAKRGVACEQAATLAFGNPQGSEVLLALAARKGV